MGFTRRSIFTVPNLVKFNIITTTFRHIEETHPGWIPDHYYEISRDRRMSDVLYMIGHVMLKYGENHYVPFAKGEHPHRGPHPEPNFIFLKVDSLLYQIGLDNNIRAGNLYTRAIGCFFANNNQQNAWTLTEVECQAISEADREERQRYAYDGDKLVGGGPRRGVPKNPYKCLTYPQIKDAIAKYLPDRQRPGRLRTEQIAYEQYALMNLFYNELRNTLKNNQGDANLPIAGYFAAELAMAIFAESVRSPDTIPSTLKLIQLREILRTHGNTFPYLYNKYWGTETTTDRHPMTRGGTWFLNTLSYQTRSNAEMWSVGFFPNLAQEDQFTTAYDEVLLYDEGKLYHYRTWYGFIEEIYDDYNAIQPEDDYLPEDEYLPEDNSEDVRKVRNAFEPLEDIQYIQYG